MELADLRVRYKLILEDWPDISGSSERSGEEELTGMYAPDCESINTARLTEDRPRLSQARGMARSPDTGSGTVSMDPTAAMFDEPNTSQRGDCLKAVPRIGRHCRELRGRGDRLGMTAAPQRGPRCSKPPIGGMTK
jgi:hypothetical protein